MWTRYFKLFGQEIFFKEESCVFKRKHKIIYSQSRIGAVKDLMWQNVWLCN